MKTSWHESFAGRYAEWSAGRTADIPFYAALARAAAAAARVQLDLREGDMRDLMPGARAEYMFVARLRRADA
jgi:hypothetical protein